MTESVTPEAITALLLVNNFAEYDAATADPMGFHVDWAALGSQVIVSLRGVDLLLSNPGEEPRALLDDYAKVINAEGYAAHVVSAFVIVEGSA
jgi:hypothetical protein